MDLNQVQWSVLPSQLLSWSAMVLVVAFSSCLDVAAIEMEVSKPLDYNRELETVYTHYYMFSSSFSPSMFIVFLWSFIALILFHTHILILFYHSFHTYILSHTTNPIQTFSFFSFLLLLLLVLKYDFFQKPPGWFE